MTRFVPVAWLSILCAAGACVAERPRREAGPVYAGDLEVLLIERCGRCHGGDDDDAGAGYRIDGYQEVLRCPSSAPDQPATQPSDARAAIVRVLERADHRELLDGAERARLERWIEAGAPLRRHGVHAPGILSPRSPDWHGALAAQDRFAPLRDPEHPSACGRCHDGAPVRPEGVTRPAAGAPACTTCHGEPEGVLACGTCHGDGAARAFPPRDRCAFGGAPHDAHAAHVLPSALRAEPLACSTCHPAADASLRGTHGNGVVEVVLDRAITGPGANFNPRDGSCTVACHSRGGEHERPRFDQAGPLGCGGCHGAPPADHFAGACDDCHRTTNARGDAIVDVSLHMNGRIDLGDGSDDCSSCHGEAGDPMPRTPAHVLHREPAFTMPIPCGECHVVPREVTSDGHLDRGARTPPDVRFGALASARGQQPEHRDGTCTEIACHGAGLPDGFERALRWTDPPTGACGGCHALPPAPPHPQSAACASTQCHGAEVTASDPPAITAPGRELHINGSPDVRGGR